MTAHLITSAAILGGEPTDMLLADGVIAAIGPEAARLAAERDDVTTVEATGLVALPGLVDFHVHLREPGREDAETVETGTRAAALGGFTAVFPMANTDPVADTAGVVEQVLRLGQDAGWVDVHPVGAVSVGRKGEHLAELGAMAASAAQVRAFSDDGTAVADPILMRRALEYVKAFDGVIVQHARDPRLTAGAQMHEVVSAELGLAGWPAVAEESIIARDVLWPGTWSSRLHVQHVSTAGSVEIIRWAKSRGIDVTAEATPTTSSRRVRAQLRPRLQVNPPLRAAADVEAVRRGLADGTLDIVATDHAPTPGGQGLRVGGRRPRDARARDRAVHRAEDDGGHRPVDLGGRRRPRHVRDPARIGRLTDQGRPLEVGEPANVVLVDPAATRIIRAEELASKSYNTPYAGMELPGRVVATFLRGRATVLGGVLNEAR